MTTIEFTQIQATVVHGLEQGNSVLKQLQKEMSLERVEKLMDETREGVEYQKEVDDALQSSMSAEDEEAVQRELEALQAEQIVGTPSGCELTIAAQDSRCSGDGAGASPRRTHRGASRARAEGVRAM